MANAIWPHLTVNDGKAAVEFYQKALGAVANHVAPMGDKIMHAHLSIGDAVFMLNDDFPEFCEGKVRAPKSTGAISPVTLHLNVPDCDAAVDRMVKAGGTVSMPPMDAFWGDRYGKVTDPFGHEWSFSTPLSPERTKAAAEEWKAKGFGV